VKKCGKKKCAAARNRQKQLKAALKRAGESCKKGSAPDISALTKGLDKDTQGRLSRLADSQSKLFDGTTKRETKDLVPGASSLGVAVGNGSQVADLKAWDPDLNQTCPPTEFSLQSKASGEMASFKAITPTQSSPESKAAVAAAPAQNSAAAQAPAIPPCKPAGTCKPFVKSFCADKAQRLETAQAERQKILVVQKQLALALNSGVDCHLISGGCDLLARAKACKKNYDAQLACYNKLIADLNTKCCGTTFPDPAKKQCCLNGKIGLQCGRECIDPEIRCCKNGKPGQICGTKLCFDPVTECCKAGKKRTDKITAISACPPPRYKKVTPNTRDYGCYKNGIIKRAWDRYQYLRRKGAPIDNPTGGGYTSFFGACYQHDGNYDACNKVQTDNAYKAAADQAFLVRMKTVCNGRDVLATERIPCHTWAQHYYDAVSENGASYYQSAQLENCKCCPLGALP